MMRALVTETANAKPCSHVSTLKGIYARLYARLCRPTLFDAGTKEFWIQKNKGGLCMSISTKAMAITGVDDRRYWSHLVTEESSNQYYNKVAQVQFLKIADVALGKKR